MPSSLQTFADFDAFIGQSRLELSRLLLSEPDDGALRPVSAQLDRLHGWTRDGRCPVQSEKDQLNFGQIASRALDGHAVADSLFELASFVTYWETP